MICKAATANRGPLVSELARCIDYCAYSCTRIQLQLSFLSPFLFFFARRESSCIGSSFFSSFAGLILLYLTAPSAGHSMGSRIVSSSYGSCTTNTAAASFIKSVFQRYPDTLFVFSAGNNGKYLPSYDGCGFPGRINLPNVVNVGATDWYVHGLLFWNGLATAPSTSPEPVITLESRSTCLLYVALHRS